jgi:quercetin dioxygenase-like cupin family protein
MTHKTKLIYGSLTVALVLGAFALGTAIAKGAAPKAPELSNLKDMTWTPLMKEGPLPAMAPIQGDGTKGAYMGYLKLPANFESPPHSHTNEYWSVLVQGKMTHWAVEGGSEKDAKILNVGDLTHMPAKVVHISKCFPGADCILVTMQKGKFDFVTPKAVATKDEKKDAKAATASAAPAPAAAAPLAPPTAAKTPAAAPAPAPGGAMAPAAPAKK